MKKIQVKTEIILINISGGDKPGVTSALTRILARYNATILDIGQADIHHTLSLGILFKTTDDNSGEIMKDLLFKAYELEINIKFSQLINYEKIGKQVEIPNVIMIHDSQGNVADELVNYTRTNSDVLFERVKGADNSIMQKELYEKLQTGQANYEKTKIRTLLEVENMGKMISKDAPFSLTEWMKDIMTSCAEEFKTTLIFKTKDTSGYVSEALEPHRIGLKIINGLKKIK